MFSMTAISEYDGWTSVCHFSLSAIRMSEQNICFNIHLSVWICLPRVQFISLKHQWSQILRENLLTYGHQRSWLTHWFRAVFTCGFIKCRKHVTLCKFEPNSSWISQVDIWLNFTKLNWTHAVHAMLALCTVFDHIWPQLHSELWPLGSPELEHGSVCPVAHQFTHLLCASALLHRILCAFAVLPTNATFIQWMFRNGKMEKMWFIPCHCLFCNKALRVKKRFVVDHE